MLASEAAIIDKQVRQVFKLAECTYKITSGFRTPEHNQRVGGVKNSYHLTNRARDVISKCSAKAVITAAQKLGLCVIVYNNHFHIDNRKEGGCFVYYKKYYRKCKENL